jgi:predicted GNAT superfamily acetyltransferase
MAVVEEREAMEQVVRVVRVAWEVEEREGIFMSVTSAIRLILGAWRGQRTFLVVWR